MDGLTSLNGGHASPDAWTAARVRRLSPTDRAKLLDVSKRGDVLVLEGPGLYDDAHGCISQSTAERLDLCGLLELDTPTHGCRPWARLTTAGIAAAKMIEGQRSPARKPCMFGWNYGCTWTALEWMRRLKWIDPGVQLFDAVEFAGHRPRKPGHCGWWRVRRDLSGAPVRANVPDAGACVYMLTWLDHPMHDGSVPAYIGKTKNARQRISAHVAAAMYKDAAIPVREYVSERRPWADSWFASVLEWAPSCGDALQMEDAYIFEAKVAAKTSPRDQYLRQRYQILNTATPRSTPAWDRACLWDAAYIRGGGHVHDAGFIGAEMYIKLEERFPTPRHILDAYTDDEAWPVNRQEAAR